MGYKMERILKNIGSICIIIYSIGIIANFIPAGHTQKAVKLVLLVYIVNVTITSINNFNPDINQYSLNTDISTDLAEEMVITEAEKNIEDEITNFFDEKYKLLSPHNSDFVGLYNNDQEHYIPPDGPLVKYPIRPQGCGVWARAFQGYEKIYRKGEFFPLLLTYTSRRNSDFFVRDIESGKLVKTGDYPYGAYHKVFMNEWFDAVVVKIIAGRSFFCPWEFYIRSEKGEWIKKETFL